MAEREDVVTAVIAAASGKLTGRVRLQKVVYLLDQLGLKSGFSYEYHHYGPYSAELASATEDAKAFELIKEEFDFRGSDGAQYSIFTTNLAATSKPGALGRLKADRAQQLLQILGTQNATVLELAATIDWLWRHEKVGDWRSEVRRRKGVKTADGRLEVAVELLREIGLAPPSTA